MGYLDLDVSWLGDLAPAVGGSSSGDLASALSGLNISPSNLDVSSLFSGTSSPMVDLSGAGLSLMGPGAPGGMDWARAIPGAVADAGGGFDWGSLFKTIGSGVADFSRVAAPALGLGIGLTGAVRGVQAASEAGKQQNILHEAQKQEQRIAEPAANYAAAVIPAAQTAVLGGPLPPGLEAQVDKFRRDAISRYRDYFSRAGISDSTMMQQVESMVDEQAVILRSQLAERLATSGFEGSRVALGPEQAVADQATRQLGTTGAAIADANRAIAILLGMDTDEKKRATG